MKQDPITLSNMRIYRRIFCISFRMNFFTVKICCRKRDVRWFIGKLINQSNLLIVITSQLTSMIFLTYPLATGKGAKPTLQDLEYVISPTFSALTTIKTNGFSSDFLDHEFPFTPPPPPPPLFFFFFGLSFHNDLKVKKFKGLAYS